MNQPSKSPSILYMLDMLLTNLHVFCLDTIIERDRS